MERLPFEYQLLSTDFLPGLLLLLLLLMEFSVDFFGQMELHLFSPRKRNGLSRII